MLSICCCSSHLHRSPAWTKCKLHPMLQRKCWGSRWHHLTTKPHRRMKATNLLRRPKVLRRISLLLEFGLRLVLELWKLHFQCISRKLSRTDCSRKAHMAYLAFQQRCSQLKLQDLSQTISWQTSAWITSAHWDYCDKRQTPMLQESAQLKHGRFHLWE